jgi:hypothetical protein
MGIATAFLQANFPVAFLLLVGISAALAALILYFLFTAQH